MSCERNQSKVSRQAAKPNGVPGGMSQGANTRGQAIFKVPPVVTTLRETQRYGRYQLGPLPVGFGTTLGNTLRRTLLSRVKGAAATSVKVKGVKHEFSTIPHVREDMTALILNLKQVRFDFKKDKPATLQLKAQGAGVFKASDLVCPPHVKVVNPEQALFTADNDQAAVTLTVTADSGYGYSPTEEREPRSEIGTIPIDAIYSPVRRAGFRVARFGVAEIARNGGRPFERVTVDVTTDGSIAPQAALRQAAGYLAGQFGGVAQGRFEAHNPVPANPYKRNLQQLGLKPRTQNALTKAGLDDVQAVMNVVRAAEIARLPGMGRKSVQDLLSALGKQGLSEVDQTILKEIQKG